MTWDFTAALLPFSYNANDPPPASLMRAARSPMDQVNRILLALYFNATPFYAFFAIRTMGSDSPFASGTSRCSNST